MKPYTVNYYPLSDIIDHFDLEDDIYDYLGSDYTWGDTAYTLISAIGLIEIIAEYEYASIKGIREEYETVFDLNAYIDLES